MESVESIWLVHKKNSIFLGTYQVRWFYSSVKVPSVYFKTQSAADICFQRLPRQKNNFGTEELLEVIWFMVYTGAESEEANFYPQPQAVLKNIFRKWCSYEELINTTWLLLYMREMETTTFFTSSVGTGLYTFNSDLSGQTAKHRELFWKLQELRRKKIIKEEVKSKHNYGHVAIHIDWYIKIQHCLLQKEILCVLQRRLHIFKK